MRHFWEILTVGKLMRIFDLLNWKLGNVHTDDTLSFRISLTVLKTYAAYVSAIKVDH